MVRQWKKRIDKHEPSCASLVTTNRKEISRALSSLLSQGISRLELVIALEGHLDELDLEVRFQNFKPDVEGSTEVTYWSSTLSTFLSLWRPSFG